MILDTSPAARAAAEAALAALHDAHEAVLRDPTRVDRYRVVGDYVAARYRRDALVRQAELPPADRLSAEHVAALVEVARAEGAHDEFTRDVGGIACGDEDFAIVGERLSKAFDDARDALRALNAAEVE